MSTFQRTPKEHRMRRMGLRSQLTQELVAPLNHLLLEEAAVRMTST